MNLLQDKITDRESRLPAHTDAYRVADGSPWPDIFIDALADRLLVSLRNTSLPRGLKELLQQTERPVYLKRLDNDIKDAFDDSSEKY